MNSGALIRKDSLYLGRVSPLNPLEIIKSEDSFLYDKNHKKYIDFLMGWCVGNIGWNKKEILKAVKKFKEPFYVNPYYLYKPWIELAEILAKITPGKLVKTFRCTGGTEAVEIAIQAAMTYTKRKKFISIEGAYHGHSIGAMSVGSSKFRKYYKNLMPQCYKISPPLNAKAGKQIEKLLKKRDVAAFISEPIIMNLGVEIPEKEFYKIVQKACKKYGTLFIADEVATGFGRTGKLFASEHYNLKPDILCMAKAIGGGYGPLGATIMTKNIAKSVSDFNTGYYSTFGWHPLSVYLALKNIKIILNNKKQLFKNVDKMNKYFFKRLKEMKFKYPANIRIAGLAIGIEFNKKNYALKIVKNCQKNGLLISDCGPYKLTIFPALNIDKKTAKEGLDILARSV
ncbi:MAG: aspartate aminotransferase family protein [Patescibacteria group bacterium]|nr:aspartate aminotransferase family protein [Patescibacteria group bacterium]MDD5121558.1 aspartate aminotransferase family protein [Patescibacteria group bacterium]MDD5222054.1 aspartate aminotransferase family protein [Patescibacteria group bacterium]MDD5396278.1 aspartate aminotransferase family protein [Patescibacteria group bacterium]